MALPKIKSKFDGAVQKSSQEQKIAELQAEVEQLRASQSPDLEAELQKLREQLQNQSGELEIDVKLIDPNPHQPRQTITSELIQTKARLLKKYGQITPIILVPQDNKRYMLLDGQLRTEAAKILGWQKIRALIVPMPEDLSSKALLTFLGFEDLNPLDKAEAIAKEATKSVGLSLAEVITMLATVLKRIERDGKSKELTQLVSVSSEEQQAGLSELGITGTEYSLLLLLLELGLNPASVKANLIPMLSLPQDLKDAIRHKGLKGAHALALLTLSNSTLNVSEKEATKERVKATEQVLKNNLTVPETRELIKKIKAKYVQREKSESKKVKTAIQKVRELSSESLSDVSREQLMVLRSLLLEKLAEIEKLTLE
ncbi:ParB N-terminal domain-containing protein [Tolypothrix bouteillei VB521301_2]|uniref:ParB/RepB/Spo0J family partition protein n=1 Tax=Tolypothrix bouteillei TaxID=1246981 RepID=UPI0005135FC5